MTSPLLMSKLVSLDADYGRVACIAAVDVTTTRTVIFANGTGVPFRVRLHNQSGNNLYISNVMAHANYEDTYILVSGIPDEVFIGPGQTLYGVNDGLTTVTKTVYWQATPMVGL